MMVIRTEPLDPLYAAFFQKKSVYVLCKCVIVCIVCIDGLHISVMYFLLQGNI
jgi:hypothetical protein